MRDQEVKSNQPADKRELAQAFEELQGRSGALEYEIAALEERLGPVLMDDWPPVGDERTSRGFESPLALEISTVSQRLEDQTNRLNRLRQRLAV